MFEFIYINISCPPIMLLHSLDYFFFSTKHFWGSLVANRYTGDINIHRTYHLPIETRQESLWAPSSCGLPTYTDLHACIYTEGTGSTCLSPSTRPAKEGRVSKGILSPFLPLDESSDFQDQTSNKHRSVSPTSSPSISPSLHRLDLPGCFDLFCIYCLMLQSQS